MADFCNEEPSTHPSASIASVSALVEKNISTASCAVRTDGSAALRIPQLARFDSSKFPQISIHDYLERLRKFARFDTSLVIGLIYVDRLLAADSNFAVTQRNVHRLLLTVATVAEKYNNDIFYCNTYYASVGGISLDEMNRLELTLLHALMWRLSVSEEEYYSKEREMALALAPAPSPSYAEDWIVVDEAVCEKQQLDTRSESSMQASTISGSESVSDSDESMDSSSEVA